VLCLNVNDSSESAADRNPHPPLRFASLRWRIQGSNASWERCRSPPMVPCSCISRARAAGFDTLDAHGQVLRHQPAFLWLQPGENRACIGCHERATMRSKHPSAGNAARSGHLDVTDSTPAPASPRHEVQSNHSGATSLVLAGTEPPWRILRMSVTNA